MVLKRLYKNNVLDKIDFLCSDLFEPLSISDKRYAICLCNPPYIPSAEIDRLQPEVQYEPRLALDGGSDGLDFYRKIIAESPGYLAKEGLLIMEIGYNQKDSLENIFRNSGKFEIIEVVKDYSGIDRVIVVKKDG